ncbi:MAG: hypothetical protein HXY29_03885 [Rhodocyclaceae bacterium]|jgi:tetratricopeptide (TPR) repeat protein|nr:hypothetical protein [Rhodocyclaceae bacterium]
MQAHWFYPALVTDIGAFFSPLAMSPQPAALWALLGMHGLASALLALSLLPVLPKHYRQQKTFALLLLFALAFMAPVLGPLAVALMLRLSFPKGGRRKSEPQTIALPEFDPRAKDIGRTAQGAIRSRLGRHVPEQLRLQSLLTLQAVPNPVANPILEGLLSDDTDDIRLVAFGMLDAKEKALSQLIQRERARLDAAASDRQRYEALRNLAELHWEMIYACLVQGELRQYMLETAWSYVQQARQYPEAAQDAPLALLAGRIQMALGHPAEAQAAFERSLQLGQPPASVLPYLAELAYLRHDHAEVRRRMEALSAYQLAPRVRALVELWTGRRSARTFRDRRMLPHL